MVTDVMPRLPNIYITQLGMSISGCTLAIKGVKVCSVYCKDIKTSVCASLYWHFISRVVYNEPARHMTSAQLGEQYQ